MSVIDRSPSGPIVREGSQQQITLAHGEGGKLTRRLIEEHILPHFDNPALASLGDAALVGVTSGQLAMTTDSFVVAPLFFPGGDIGKLAVLGTINDLAVAGARPRWLSLSLIIEEGLPLSVLDAVLRSAAEAAHSQDVAIVTGDTKVVPRGAADGLFLTTSAIGEIVEPAPFGPSQIVPGDQLIVSGPIGRHGVAILAAREQLGFQPPPQSDCASLLPAVDALRAAGVFPRCLRDATRGGVAAVLHEWAAQCGHSFIVREADLPVSPEVRGVCELLGLDPLHVANEGTLVAAVAEQDVGRALAALRNVPGFQEARHFAEAAPRDMSAVAIRGPLGSLRALDEPLGAPLPRIC